MISFLDLFKWDRFVATSFIELLFWLLAAVAVLLGISGLVGGISLVSTSPGGGLLAIALSIVGALAGIVAARVVCEAVIMLFRVNENLMDIRDNLGAIDRLAPAPHSAPAPVVAELSFAEVLEEALAEPMLPPAATDEFLRADTRGLEARSAETSSLEARLAEIRARREGTSAPARVEPAPAVSPPRPAPSSARGHSEEPAAPAWAPEPAPAAARAPAPEVRPVSAPKHAEAKQPESRKSELRKPAASDEPVQAKPAEAKPVDAKLADVAPAEVAVTPVVKPPEGAAPQDAGDAAEKLVDAASDALAREAEKTADIVAGDKPKANDAA
ncbi:hypothetical protein K32_32780 [Kaistia sp. 32K]|uniref:DUF4282 domain-containing protein n=1 Tax=Kaistia sp. 32K TaxID=2795690 RepID=UPI0019168AE4|nr:DUF4282 domain-containing protein [Kaistia sp. 32K]BCP54661.1 hypothetical protein K32_32780 [Kaistia sp. 32K]